MVQTGISTASLFGRYKTENAVKELNGKVETAEVFLESYCEYNKRFGKKINKNKGKLDIHSVHTLTTQFEPQLYSINERAKEDSFALLDSTMKCAEVIGAKYYTFHGVARLKKLPITINFDKHAEDTQKIIEVCKKHGVQLAYENVHWSYYNYVGFLSEIKKRTQGLKCTLDIKQARLSGYNYEDYILEMGEDIATVHLSDIDENGKMCLPGKGIFDFPLLFKRLKDVGFDGALLLEVYPSDFKEISELYNSLDYINELREKILNR